MRDKDDESRIKAYMEAKMKHIKMYNECMNLADGLDVEKFAELVRQDEREACAAIAEEMERDRFDSVGDPRIKTFESQIAKAIRARGER